MRLGKAAMEALQAEISGLLTPGNELVVAGAIALYGTAQIAREKHEILREHFSEGFLREAENLRTLYGIADEINVKEAGATAFYAMGEGGFSECSVEDGGGFPGGTGNGFFKVPIRQETIEICEIFDINPYKLNSEGAVLIGIPAGEALVQELRRMGMMAAVIGQTNAGNDRMLYYNGNGRYLERPAKDEIYKILP